MAMAMSSLVSRRHTATKLSLSFHVAVAYIPGFSVPPTATAL